MGLKMKNRVSVNLGNLLLSLSEAMDLASPLMAQHQQRTAFIAWEIAKAAHLSEELIGNIFVAGLLHDIGSFSVEEKLALIKFETHDPDPHCIRGAILLEKVPYFSHVATLVRFHHKEWQDWDEPLDTYHVLGSQIILLADYVERLVNRDEYILHQNERIITEITSKSGEFFHSDLVDAYVATAAREDFWLDLASSRLYSILLHDGPSRKMEVDILAISSITELFKSIIDFKSRFTATHSSGVAACAEILSKMFGLTDREIQLIKVAGDLHDLGKLVVPESILEKESGLIREEFAVVKSHTYFTYSLLSRIRGLEEIAEWAAFHHEKLDGSGYPFHCVAGELSTEARIMAVADVFTAIAEDRPYRKGMSRNEIIRILKQFSDRQLLDTKIVNLLLNNYDDVFSYVAEIQTNALQFYKKQFAFPPKNESSG